MPPPPPNGLLFSIDLFTSLVLAVTCFVIYLLTSEFYTLTKHEGIKYFRYAFFFFGISFFAQALFPLLHVLELRPPPYMFAISIYAGSVAVLSLLYSVLWKRLRIRYPMLLIQGLSLLLASTVFLGLPRRLFFHPLFVVQILLFAVAIFVSYRDSKTKAGHALGLHIIYTLVFLSWIANSAANVAMRESVLLAASLNVLSCVFFILILVRVYKKTHLP